MKKFLKAIFLFWFGGCPGCRDATKDHDVSKSFVHTNHPPTSPCPTRRKTK